MHAIEPASSPILHAPVPRVPIAVRVATTADLPFMDSLQKAHSKQLGYFPTKQFEGYIEQGTVLIAETTQPRRREDAEQCAENPADDLMFVSAPPRLRGCISTSAERVGYVIAKDRYLKRDELGVVYQLCVAPGNQRKLIGASLLKAVFERSAYGCRLYCCWCAQDIAANHFWESMGFVPVAFRAGSTGKKRVHIFWQKRINADDAETKWWYPFQTNGGAIRAARVVFPIPPGTHWSEVRAVAVPSCGAGLQPVLEDARHGLKTRATKSAHKPAPAPMGGFRFQSDVEPVKNPKQKKPKPLAVRIDPKYLKAARELRDRYLEHVNGASALPEPSGKYDVARSIDAGGRCVPALPPQPPPSRLESAA
jgi:ribosomal protein S18 acetylase RimI-like enzyme